MADCGGSRRLPDHGIFEVHTERRHTVLRCRSAMEPLATPRWSPFAELLFGGRKVTYEVDNPELENKSCLANGTMETATLPHYPKRTDWSAEVASNGACLAAGGGVDVVITRPFAWRLINIQYTRSWTGGVDNIHPDNGFRITTEAVLRIGTW